jgi:glycosyltransferase involved in cell wall biosynthesis
MHGMMHPPDLWQFFEEYREVPLISISNDQRVPIPHGNWQRTIYHGLPPDLFTFSEEGGHYLAFLGRMSPEKGVDRAIGIARETGVPIDWPEPFGLVMIEALACGTPVIAWRRGSVPEVLADGLTGYIVESVPEAGNAVGRLDQLNRCECRRVFEERFTDERMARDHLRVYERLAKSVGSGA